MLTALFTGIMSFAATNVDDILLLVMFFSQANREFRPHHVVIGQYLGFAVLVELSLFGFIGGLVIPAPWMGLLGLVPLGLGLRKLWSSPEAHAAARPFQTMANPVRRRTFFPPQIFKVAMVTIANGGDNLGIYTPLFASSSVSELIVLLAVFFVMVGAWCWIGYQLTHRPLVAASIARYGHILGPFVLIGLGIWILWESGSITWLMG